MDSSDISGSPDERQAEIALGAKIAALRSTRDAYWGRLVRSLALLGAGLAVSIWTYLSAVFSESGGAYFIFFGAVIYGAGNAYVAARRYFQAKRVLAETEGQHPQTVVDAAVSAWADDLIGDDSEDAARGGSASVSAAGARAGLDGVILPVRAAHTRMIGMVMIGADVLLLAAATVFIGPFVLDVVSRAADPGEYLAPGMLVLLPVVIIGTIAYVGFRMLGAAQRDSD